MFPQCYFKILFILFFWTRNIFSYFLSVTIYMCLPTLFFVWWNIW
jgi:hypothetical protein